MTTPSVTATATEPTHDVTLSDGTNTYGLIACDFKGRKNINGIRRNPTTQHAFKMYSGSTKWADLQPPYNAVSQDDWSGGLGVGEFERNTSGYRIAHGINTMIPNRAFLGPLPQTAIGYTGMDVHNLGSSFTRTSLYGTTTYCATKFTASSSYTTAKVYVYVGPYGSPSVSDLRVGIWSDNAGTPNVELAGTTGGPTNTNILGELWEYSIATALTASSTYWIVISATNGTSTSYWWVGGAGIGTSLSKASSNGTSWSSAGTGNWAYYTIMATTKTFTAKFAEYKGSLYACLSYDDGTAPTLWRVGHQGVCSSGTTTILTDSTASFTTDSLIGGVLKLVSGTGSSARVNYRTITDNDATTITVSPAFDIAPANGTIYAVTGVGKPSSADYFEKFSTVSATNQLDYTVTDMKSLNGALYFCMGPDQKGESLIVYNNSGTWTPAWNDESATHFKFNSIEQVRGTDGKSYIWGAGTNFVKKAEAIDFTAYTSAPTDLNFSIASAIYVGDYQTKIMGIEKYGSPQTIWVLKEDKIYSIEDDKPIEIPLQEMVSVKSEENGYAHTTQGVYLYFSLLKSMERYYNNNLDDINPQRDVGLPSNQRGPITAMVSYPGKIFFSIDAGTSGYSSIYVWDGIAFHEYYRGEYGKSIKSLYVQTIPGSKIDYLWLSEGNKIKYLPISIIPFDDSNYPTIPEGFLETPWIYAGQQDVYKTYKSLRLFMEGASGYYINAYYMKDSDSTWTEISGNFDSTPSEEINLTSPISAKRIKLGLRFSKINTASNPMGTTTYYTPYLRAWVLTGTMSLPVKWAYTIRFKVTDESQTREGDDDNYTRLETLVNQLDSWAAAGTPLTLRSIISWMDNKTVIVDPASVSPTSVIPDDQFEKGVAQVTLLEV